MERHPAVQIAAGLQLAGYDATRFRESRQAKARHVSLVVSGRGERTHPSWLVLGPEKALADGRGTRRHLLSVGGPQWHLAVESIAGLAGPDSRRPTGAFAIDVGHRSRNVR